MRPTEQREVASVGLVNRIFGQTRRKKYNESTTEKISAIFRRIFGESRRTRRAARLAYVEAAEFFHDIAFALDFLSSMASSREVSRNFRALPAADRGVVATASSLAELRELWHLPKREVHTR